MEPYNINKSIFKLDKFMTKNIFIKICFICTFFLSATVYFSNLGHGTPSLQKHLLIFRSLKELKLWIPKIIELRNQYYKGMGDLLNPNKPFKETYDKLFLSHTTVLPFNELPQTLILDRIRGYLIGVMNSDEQNTMKAIGQLNPLKLQFNPGVNSFYGGFYYYSCGGTLIFAKFIGYISLKSNIDFYFLHPEETRRMYILIRSIGVISTLLTGCLLFFWIGNLNDYKNGLLSFLFFIFTPGLVPYSHFAKAHTYGMFLTFLGFYFAWKTIENPSKKNYLLSGLFLGCSAGSIITNLTVGSVLFFVEFGRNNWKFKPIFLNKKFWMSCIIFLGAYLITNYYIFTDFAGFQRFLLTIKEYLQGYDESYGEFRFSQSMQFLKDMFTSQIHWSIFPFLVTGCIASAISDKLFFKICFHIFVFLLLMNILFTRHPGVNMRIMPLVAILSTFGCTRLLKCNFKLFKGVIYFYIFFTISISFLKSYFYSTFNQEPDHFFSAGQWTNSRIPKGETIGVMGGILSQVLFPPIYFLDYKLISIPLSLTQLSFTKENLPNYVISRSIDHPILQKYYEIAQSWVQPNEFLGIPFETKGIFSGHVDLFILKKKE
ncbi:MAG: hypothetical protein A3G85_03305 [Elusimicrobia bacterium RIFCSPLOWO2_12_FULL_39_28]|nr:MAG: hypothetical protein A3G85_03305 [Elusimicrobia bacterium RIFCSPLOWO2_12_FULL_39_28]